MVACSRGRFTLLATQLGSRLVSSCSRGAVDVRRLSTVASVGLHVGQRHNHGGWEGPDTRLAVLCHGRGERTSHSAITQTRHTPPTSASLMTYCRLSTSLTSQSEEGDVAASSPSHDPCHGDVTSDTEEPHGPELDLYITEVKDRTDGVVPGRGAPPDPPTTCCMSGCANCVWIEYADRLKDYYKDGGLAAKAAIKEQVEDPNLRAFLLLEIS